MLELSVGGNYSSEIRLSEGVKTELQWLVQILHLNNGRSVISYSPQLIIASDASLEGWVAFCQGHKTRGHWTLSEKKNHINILELRAAKYAVLTFTHLYPTAKIIHIKMDNIVALSYLMKIGGTRKIITCADQQGNLGIFTGQGDHNYCKVPPRSPQQGS